MEWLDTPRSRAALLIVALGVALAVALWPFATGLIAAPVLYVVFSPVHQWLARRMRPTLAAGLVLVLAAALIVGPGVSFVSLVASEGPQIARNLRTSTLLAKFSTLQMGPIDVGAQLKLLGERLGGLAAASALYIVGAATDLTISVTVAFFGLFYLLISPDGSWAAVRPFIPFSAASSELLRQRFRDVTISTLLGTGLTAFLQGSLLAVGFKVVGLPNALLWGVTTMVLSILPLVGAGLVWVPAVVSLAIGERWGAALGLTVWSLLIVGSVDNVIRPWVYNRYAKLHPFMTVIGAFAGIQWFGLLGLLIGPLAISYFFELMRMYREEYLRPREPAPR